MGSFSALHWIVVAVVVLVLFGRGKLSEAMGDFGKGINSFRQGMREEAEAPKVDATPAALPPAEVLVPAPTEQTRS